MIKKAKDLVYLFGTGKIPLEETDIWIDNAFRAGVEAFDLATLYGNEKEVAQSIKKHEKKYNRKVFVQTKLQTVDFNNCEQALKNSLDALDRGPIDLYLLHRPGLNLQEARDAWKFLVSKQKEGVLKEIGVSNFDRDLIDLLYHDTGVYPAVNQIEMNVNSFRADRYQYALRKGIKIQAYGPLGKGKMENQTLTDLATQTKRDEMSLALSYLTTQGISVVNKSSKFDRIVDNLKACALKLTPAEIQTLYLANKSDPTYWETLEPKIIGLDPTTVKR